MAEEDSKERKQQLKDTKARLAVEKDIANIADRASRSLKDYSDVVKQIRDIDKEIVALSIAIEKSTGEEKEELKQKLATQQLLSKELKEELSITKAIGKEIGGAVLGALSRQTKLLSSGLGMYYDINESVRKTSMSLGLSAGRMKTLSQSAQNVAGHYTAIGLSSKDAVDAQATYSEEVGRTVMLSEKALNLVGDLGLKTGLGAKGVGEMAGQMEQFGMGSTVALDYISEIRDTSQAMGINSGKVLKKTQQNFKLLNKLNFKGGVKGLGKMAAFSEKFKISMDSVASSAEKVFSPEGAIETAANLQMLGGGFSALADPFKLMFDARNDPQKYAEGIVDSLSGIAKFKDGEFIVSAYELQRLEEAGKALGFSKEEMVGMAKQKAKMDKIGGSLMGFDKDEQELLTGMIDFDKNGKALIDGKSLKSMSKTQLDTLLEQQKTSEQNVKDAMSAREQWKAIGNQMIAATLPLMEWLNSFLEPIVKTISSFIEKTPPWISAIGVGLLVVVGKASEWYLKGIRLGKGFNLAVNKGGWLKKLIGVPKKIAKWVGGKIGLGKQSTASDLTKETTSDTEKVTKGGGTGQSLKSLAGGLEAMGTGKVLAGALNLIPTSIGMISLLPAIPTLMFLGMVKLKQLSTNLFEMALGLESMGGKKVLAGAAILSVAAIGFNVMQKGILGLGAVALLGESAGFGMEGLAVGLEALGAAATGPAWLGVALLGALSLVFIGFSYGVKLVAEGIAAIVGSFAEMFAQISSDNIMSLLLLGPALMGISLGVMMLGGSLLVLAATMAMGGWLGLLALGTAAESVGEAFNGIDANGITKSVDAINNVDMDKINALKELSTAMAVWGMFGSKPITVNMEVDGEIKLGGANGKTFDISELTPAQVSELKDLIFQKQNVDSTGGYV